MYNSPLYCTVLHCTRRVLIRDQAHFPSRFKLCEGICFSQMCYLTTRHHLYQNFLMAFQTLQVQKQIHREFRLVAYAVHQEAAAARHKFIKLQLICLSVGSKQTVAIYFKLMNWSPTHTERRVETRQLNFSPPRSSEVNRCCLSILFIMRYGFYLPDGAFESLKCSTPQGWRILAWLIKTWIPLTREAITDGLWTNRGPRLKVSDIRSHFI